VWYISSMSKRIPDKPTEKLKWLASTARDQHVNVRMPGALFEAVQRYANREGYTLSFAIVLLLTTHSKMR
jgi:hypothetical protein